MSFTERRSDNSDVGRVWTEAIDQYCKDTRTDPAEFRNMRNLNAIMDEQKRQVDRFESFRHSGKAGDQIRHFVNKNSDIILSAAKQIGSAASASFPPAATIVTAFTWIMKAAKDTSSDYDMIETFFSIMHSFLERISLLENKLPAVNTYQTMLARVFGSMLGLCSIASQYQKDGRFLKWGKALFKGSDDKLKGSVDDLNGNIQRLESATLFATLGQTIDIYKATIQIGGIVSENLAVTQKTLASSEETNVIVKESAMLQQESFESNQRIEKMILKISRERERKPQKDSSDHMKADKGAKSKDAGARLSVALNQIRNDLFTTAQPSQTLTELEPSFVKGTFKWLPDTTTYQNFANGTEPLLLVTGERGLGKTNLAFYAIDDLRGLAQDAADRRTVAYFFFEEEHEHLRSIKNFAKSLVIQIAEADPKYREEIVPELQKIRNDIEADDGTLIWEKLIVAKYPTDAEAKLILVVDGTDELESEDRTKLLGLLAQIKKASLQISVLITSRLAIEDWEAPRLALTMDLLKKDTKLIIRQRIKSLSKLKRLELRARKQIVTKLLQKADSILYVEHALRRLNGLGREALIMKELRELPDSLSRLYDVLLDECRKGRTQEELASLKRLFAWLAFSERQLTLGEASTLVRLVDHDPSLSVEEEVDGRLARLLRLAQYSDDAEMSSDESENDLLESADDTANQASQDPSIWFPLRFQDRALRQYFRDLTVNEDGLRSSPSSAHLIIFRTIAMTLTKDKPEHSTINLPMGYAADYWIQHFLEVQVEQLSDQEVKQGIESLCAIVLNRGNAIEKIEENASQRGIFGDATDLPDNMVTSVRDWTGKVLSLPSELFDSETLHWVHDISGDTTKLMTQIARQHCYNWFNRADYQEDAYESFEFANRALRLVNKVDKKLNVPGERPTAEQILYVSDAFPELVKTSRAYRGIGLALKRCDYYEEGLAQCRKALEISETELERYHALGSILQAAVYLAELVDKEDEEKLAHYIREAKETSNEIAKWWEQYESQSQEPGMIEHQQGNLGSQAECALLEDDVDSAIAFIQSARSLSKDQAYIDNEVLDKLTLKLYNVKDYRKLIECIETMSDIEKIFWLAYYNHDIFQQAAVESNKHEFLVETFELVLKQNQVPYGGAMRLRYSLASYYQTVVWDFEQSQKWLKQVLYSSTQGEQISEDTVLQARSALAEVLMEGFRMSSDSSQKASILDEMKTLASSGIALGADYSPEMSNTAIPHALMLRKLGPLPEFESALCKSFNACIEALSDDVASNDHRAVRFFGKVLACLPGLQRDAQIALASQFYWLNPTFKAQAKFEAAQDGPETAEEIEKVEIASEAVDDGACMDPQNQEPPIAQTKMNGQITEPNFDSMINEHAVGDSKNADLKDHAAVQATMREFDEGQTPNANGDTTDDGKTPPDEANEVNPAITEDLDGQWSVFCNGCSNIFSHSAGGKIYTCIVCTDTDLCADCYHKRMALNRGEKLEDWRTFCGKDHHYVKHAPEGWKGVKDGMINVGEEKIEFGEWLKQVQERWKASWADFWKAEDGVFDAL